MFRCLDEGEELVNIITKVIMPSLVKEKVCNQDDIDHHMYIKFVEEGIIIDSTNIRARIIKVQLKIIMTKSIEQEVLIHNIYLILIFWF